MEMGEGREYKHALNIFYKLQYMDIMLKITCNGKGYKVCREDIYEYDAAI